MTIAKLCRISGRVQGVYYRASAQQQARLLGIRGYANNLADGRVEVLAMGEVEQVDALVRWLWQGSPLAHVTGVEVVEVEIAKLNPAPNGFATG